MSRAPQRSRQAPVRRPTPRRTPRRASTREPGSTASKRSRWVLVGAGVLVLVLAWRLAMTFLGGEEEDRATPPSSGATGSSGPGVTRDAPPAPEGSRTSAFPTPVEGTRLELRVVGLGDSPAHCVPQSLRTPAGVRTPYHHRCFEEPGLDRYFFLVRLTNKTDGRVFVNLDDFAVVGPNGHPRPAFTTPPLGSPATRFIPSVRAIASEESLRGWITIDGTDGFSPAALVYEDGAESLRVRFQGVWV